MSADGGSSWQNVTGDLPAGAAMASMAYSPENSFVYGVRYAGSVYKMDIRELLRKKEGEAP